MDIGLVLAALWWIPGIALAYGLARLHHWIEKRIDKAQH